MTTGVGRPAEDETGQRVWQGWCVPSTTSGDQSLPQITTLANRNVLVTWVDNSQTGGDTSYWAVRAQILGPTGTKFLVKDYTFAYQYEPDVVATPDGGFAIAWRHTDALNDYLSIRYFNASGQALTASYALGRDSANGGKEGQVALAALANGTFVATWTEQTPAAGFAFSICGSLTRLRATRGACMLWPSS